MQLKQCTNGHFYDQSRFKECPYCNSSAATPAATTAAGNNDGFTVAIGEGGFDDSGRTQVLIKKELGIDPVVGWFVCIEGKDKGKDYRIHADYNYIGRSEKMDICIKGDDTISREKHAVVTYDSQEKVFCIFPCEGRSIIRLQGKAIYASEVLEPFDVVQIGNTKLMFVPLCGGQFNWND